MSKNSDWATYGMMEYPFWRNDMQPEEFDREREYYCKNMDKVQNGTYLPLWKQNEDCR